MQPLKVNPEYRSLVPRPSDEEYRALEANILEKGEATEPIITNKDLVILDGHTRYEICSKHGLFYRVDQREFESELDEKIYVVESNVLRRHLDPIQKTQLGLILEPLYAEKAKKNMSEGGKYKVAPIGATLDTDKEISKKVGLGEGTYQRGKAILKRAPEKLKEEVKTGKKSVARGYKELRTLEKREESPIETPPLPDKKYRCLVIDPPWEMQKIEREERPEQGKYLDYPTMSLEEIEKIPIRELAYEEGCHVYLWTTHKRLPDALNLFEKWGVKYQCLMTWVKPTGMTPYSWMYNTEHVLFGRIGNLQLEKLGIKLSFEASSREHSRKPDIFYDIVRQASPEPRLDMFSREPREGYELWGNEVDKFV